LGIAHKYGFLVLVASQLNNEVCRGHRTLVHLPPRPHYVQNGGHKRQIATWMLGIYKPLRLVGLDEKALDHYNETGEGYADVIEPGTMAITVSKHRLLGHLEGSRALLGVERGRVIDLAARDIGLSAHGIATTRRVDRYRIGG
jgi:hypothetical protein